ncbi:saccharopine dehydrogenase [Apiospora arundinis]
MSQHRYIIHQIIATIDLSKHSSPHMAGKKILILGSGRAAKPCVEYLLRNPENTVMVASHTRPTAEALVEGHANASALVLEVKWGSANLEAAIADHDIVVSLVPIDCRSTVIDLAILTETNLVTATYISRDNEKYESLARSAGVTLLSEVGINPGIDHPHAAKVIDEVHSKGGKVREFYSYCGALPAPASSNNPLRFQSQWNLADYLENSEVNLVDWSWTASEEPYHFIEGYAFKAYPNRDPIPYQDFYQIPEAHAVIRSSLRYKGNPALVKALFDLHWLNPYPQGWLVPGKTWAQLQQQATKAATDSEKDLVAQVDAICNFPDPKTRTAVLDGLRWIGLFSKQMADVRKSPLDTLSARLADICSSTQEERLLFMLQHKFVVEWPDKTKETITSTLELQDGPHEHSGMERVVGVTCGIATQLLLDGHPAIARPGVIVPYAKDVCDPIREKLEPEGVKLVAKSTRG